VNEIKLEHPGKDKDGKPSYVVGGIGKVYVNGQLIEGVLDIKPNVLDRSDVASVTLTIAVSKFTFGPREYLAYQATGDDREFRIPTMRD
jgi:hypothetical protein